MAFAPLLSGSNRAQKADLTIVQKGLDCRPKVSRDAS
jgi:hypothetical protein